MAAHGVNIARCHALDGVGEGHLGGPAKAVEGTCRPHMHGEAMQMQHIPADSVDAEEGWKVAKGLERDDRFQMPCGIFRLRERLREPGNRQAARQYIDGEVPTETGLDAGKQADQGKRIATEIKEIRMSIDRRYLQHIFPDFCRVFARGCFSAAACPPRGLLARWRRQRLAIELAVGRQGHCVERHKKERHHVARQLPLERDVHPLSNLSPGDDTR